MRKGQKDFLYHYTSFTSFEKMMQSKNLWLVASTEMADMTDRYYANLYVLTALYNIDDKDVLLLRDNLTQNDIIEVNMETFEAPFYSASFCYEKENDYLWKHYADMDKGVAICFDKEFFSKSVREIVCKYYRAIDEADEAHTEIITIRDVLYDVTNTTFLDIVKKTKPDPYYLSNSPNAYKTWLLLILSTLAGVVKAKQFSSEREARVLFVQKYLDEYITKHPIHLMLKHSMEDALKNLGLIGKPIVTEEAPKKRYELDLSTFWGERLIPHIIIGDSFSDVDKLKEVLNNNGLCKTQILNKKGERQ